MRFTMKYLEDKLRLKVNEEISKVASVIGLKYLRFQTYRSLQREWSVGVHRKSKDRFIQRIKGIMKKNYRAPWNKSLDTSHPSSEGGSDTSG